jgi:hypothetical protein
VLPTFVVVPVLDGGGIRDRIGSSDRSQLVHAEQAIELHGQLPTTGRIVANTSITGS